MTIFTRVLSLFKGISPDQQLSDQAVPFVDRQEVVWPFVGLAVVTQALDRSPILLRQQRYVEAEQLLQTAVMHSPDHRDILVSLAHVSHGLKNWPEAERRWQAVIDLYPDLHYPHGYHATAVLMQDRRSEAISLYLGMISRFPTDLGPSSQLAYMLETMTPTERGSCLSIVDDALSNFRAFDQHSVLALKAHARVARAQGDWHMTRNRLRLALQLANNDTEIAQDLEVAQSHCT